MYAILHGAMRHAALAFFSRADLIDELVERHAITPNQGAALRTGDKARLLTAMPAYALVDELRSRGLLTEAEAMALNTGAGLATVHARVEVVRGEGVADTVALDRAQGAIRDGDLAEALLQTARAIPELRDLPDLAARTGRQTQKG